MHAEFPVDAGAIGADEDSQADAGPPGVFRAAVRTVLVFRLRLEKLLQAGIGLPDTFHISEWSLFSKGFRLLFVV